MPLGTSITHKLLNQDLLLLPQKAIFWQQQKALIVADVHLGKVGHFRKAGIAIPRDMEQNDLGVLSDLISVYQPEKLIFLGDFFHSELNTDWDWFILWRAQFPKLEIILIKGNHDIIDESNYLKQQVKIMDSLFIEPFLMLHHPLQQEELANAIGFVFCGHLHPGISLKGKGRQHLTLPCFAFGAKQAVLPSFGRFTGKVAINPTKTDCIYAVLKDSVMVI